MNQPNFVCGTNNVTLEHPSEMYRTIVLKESISETLGGNVVSDVLSRKFKYKLSWNGLQKSSVESLLTLANYHVENGVAVTFTYPKWTSTAGGINCIMRIGELKPIGSGSADYRVEFEMELIEVNNRM